MVSPASLCFKKPTKIFEGAQEREEIKPVDGFCPEVLTGPRGTAGLLESSDGETAF